MKPSILFLMSLCALLLSPKIYSQSVAINEILASNSAVNADEDGSFEDWIELYNYGVTSVNLEGFGLSDDESRPFKWVFPNVILAANGYMLVWASDKNRTNPTKPLHANFKISVEGETITLTHRNGTVLNQAPATDLQSGFSLGRLPNGTGGFLVFQNPSPNQPNIANAQAVSAPTFSHVSGFYTFDLSLTLGHSDPDATIVYSTDGSEPDINNISGTEYQHKNIYPNGPFIVKSISSNLYENELLLRDRTPDPNKLAYISTTQSAADPDYFPSSPIRKANVIKAKAYVNGVTSPTISHTYFISAANGFNHSLPVVSITVNENELFDFHDGIYVAGIDNLNGVGENKCGFFNWNRDTEVAANFQFFVNQQNVINQNIGLRIHGGCMRTSRVKSLRLYARSDYDVNNTFGYPFFENYNYNSFKRLMLRNSGNDGDHTLFRDAFMQRLVAHLSFDTQEYSPVVHYINGEYWGLINMRERYDNHYFERVYGIAEEELDLLENNGLGSEAVKDGDNSHWTKLYRYIEQNDLSLPSTYSYVVTQMDEVNFMDYQIANIYFANTDWPVNNVSYFRKKTTSYESNATYGQDGRWRWVMFDTDFGFGLYNIKAQHNTLEHATDAGGLVWPTLFLRQLLKNETFRIQFINRYADLINTAFVPERAVSLINQMKDVISSEIPNHRSRWAIPTNWEGHVDIMINFANQRPEFARQHIQDFFGIAAAHTIQLDVSSELHGHIRINRTDIEGGRPGIEENPYPWTGMYFENIPISVEAIPSDGYAFSHWSGASDNTEEELILRPTGDLTVTAHFIEKEEAQPDLLYFWLMDSNIPNDIPLERLEPTFVYDGDMQKAEINYQSSLAGYPFSQSHPNWRLASMERRNQPTSINYLPQANEGNAYGDANLRGLQIKQPFENGGARNTLYLEMNLIGYESIKLSFAAVDEGAAQSIKVDYFDAATNDWSVGGLPQDSFPINGIYNLIEVDFSSLAHANLVEDFRVRLRFDGEDMTASEGNRVTFNNISVSGIYNPVLSAEEIEGPDILVYPNPFDDHIRVKSNRESTFNYQIFDMNGRQVQKGILVNDRIEAGNLMPGIYILVFSDDRGSKRFKVLKR